MTKEEQCQDDNQEAIEGNDVFSEDASRDKGLSREDYRGTLTELLRSTVDAFEAEVIKSYEGEKAPEEDQTASNHKSLGRENDRGALTELLRSTIGAFEDTDLSDLDIPEVPEEDLAVFKQTLDTNGALDQLVNAARNFVELERKNGGPVEESVDTPVNVEGLETVYVLHWSWNYGEESQEFSTLTELRRYPDTLRNYFRDFAFDNFWVTSYQRTPQEPMDFDFREEDDG